MRRFRKSVTDVFIAIQIYPSKLDIEFPYTPCKRAKEQKIKVLKLTTLMSHSSRGPSVKIKTLTLHTQ